MPFIYMIKYKILIIPLVFSNLFPRVVFAQLLWLPEHACWQMLNAYDIQDTKKNSCKKERQRYGICRPSRFKHYQNYLFRHVHKFVLVRKLYGNMCAIYQACKEIVWLSLWGFKELVWLLLKSGSQALQQHHMNKHINSMNIVTSEVCQVSTPLPPTIPLPSTDHAESPT